MSGDCGCGAAADQRAKGEWAERAQQAEAQHLKARPHRAQQQNEPAPGDPSAKQYGPGAGAAVLTEERRVVAGPIVQLNPRDGLFLRGEHLEGIQTYATVLSRALGVSVGTGVAYGFGLAIVDDQWLTATPGLAITPSGQVLQSSGSLVHSIRAEDLPTLEDDGFWVVEVVPDEDYTGSENVYGTVCAHPCDGTTAVQPWRRSLVRLRLRADVLRGLDGKPGTPRRNWLASAYFERERTLGQPWPVPSRWPAGPADVVTSILDRPWSEAGGPDSRSAVPLGVLTTIDGTVVLDTWTARRELAGPPGLLRWDGQLGRRSWSVFLAQVLQFQDQLSGNKAELCTAEIEEAPETKPDPFAAAAAAWLARTDKLTANLVTWDEF
jgi:hypothetical protein